tara:strand:- start:405 stop:569 length:165 start_codon:yes stop_codon:yes gene_type:complete
MKIFKNVIISVWRWVTERKRVIAMDVPRHCDTRAEKVRIIKATEKFLERNIIIN